MNNNNNHNQQLLQEKKMLVMFKLAGQANKKMFGAWIVFQK